MTHVVITGGNKGLGLAQTKHFLAGGATVHVVARTAGDLSSVTGDCNFVKWDLGNGSDVDYLDQVFAKTGSIDVLVNNAGRHLKKPIWEVESHELDTVMDLNVKAMFMACGRYISLQKDKGGAIVNIASMASLLALPSAAAYVTSKTAVIGLTRSVAVDAARFGIRCNAVCPGFIDTEMTRAILLKDPARRAKIEDRIPGSKFGRPEDVADAVTFLAGPQARHINGVALPVDGGFSIGF